MGAGESSLLELTAAKVHDAAFVHRPVHIHPPVLDLQKAYSTQGSRRREHHCLSAHLASLVKSSTISTSG